jgi:hypothetical protein
VAFLPWHLLRGVRNNSLKKSARYEKENPPRPDLPKREPLEATSQRFSIKFLLAVMNSSVAREFLRGNRRSNIHLYPDDWKQLPIPDVAPEIQAPIVTLVAHILAAKTKAPSADVSELEEQVDRLVRSTYGMKEPTSGSARGRKVTATQEPLGTRSSSKGRTREPRKSVMQDDPDLA